MSAAVAEVARKMRTVAQQKGWMGATGQSSGDGRQWRGDGKDLGGVLGREGWEEALAHRSGQETLSLEVHLIPLNRFSPP